MVILWSVIFVHGLFCFVNGFFCGLQALAVFVLGLLYEIQYITANVEGPVKLFGLHG